MISDEWSGASAEKPVVLIPVETRRPGGLRISQLMFAVGVVAVILCLGMALQAWFFGVTLITLAAAIIGLIVILMRRSSSQQESLLQRLPWPRSARCR